MYGTRDAVGPRREELREQDVEREEREDEVDPAAAERGAAHAAAVAASVAARGLALTLHPPGCRALVLLRGLGPRGGGRGHWGCFDHTVVHQGGLKSTSPTLPVDHRNVSFDFAELLMEVLHRRASDLHVTAGQHPVDPGPWSPRAARGLPRPDDGRDARGHLLDPHERPAPAPRDGLAARLRLRHPRRRPLPRQRVRPAPGDLRRVPAHPAGAAEHRRPRPADRPPRLRQAPARHGPRHRPDRLGQVDLARRDHRRDQPHARGAHPHDRGPDRVPAQAQEVHRQPARDRLGRPVLRRAR